MKEELIIRVEINRNNKVKIKDLQRLVSEGLSDFADFLTDSDIDVRSVLGALKCSDSPDSIALKVPNPELDIPRHLVDEVNLDDENSVNECKKVAETYLKIYQNTLFLLDVLKQLKQN